MQPVTAKFDLLVEFDLKSSDSISQLQVSCGSIPVFWKVVVVANDIICNTVRSGRIKRWIQNKEEEETAQKKLQRREKYWTKLMRRDKRKCWNWMDLDGEIILLKNDVDPLGWT